LEQELEIAEEKLKTLGKNKPSQSKTTGSSRSMQALEQQNEKLIEEYNTLKRESKEDEEKILKMKQ
jgi:hypothetical protein